jgi:Mrp family chromosome partitioning ATPase
MIVSGDMEPVIRYLQGIGANGSVATMVVGEREPDSAATITVGLAEALQTLGARVLMIDAGLASPTLDSLLRFNIEPGLVEVTNGTETLSRAVRRVGLSEGLDVLTVGSVDGLDQDVDEPMIRAASFERLLNEARLQYHTILIVGGSLTTSTVVPELAPLTDGLIIGTDRYAGELADPLLHDLLAEFPTPTLELLSGPSVGGMVATLSSSATSGM